MSVVAVLTLLHAESIDDALAGFDEGRTSITQTDSGSVEEALNGFDETASSNAPNDASVEEALSGFEKANVKIESQNPANTDDSNCTTCKSDIAPPNRMERLHDISGYLKQQAVYSYEDKSPHRGWSSLRTTLFLDFEHKFDNGWKLKSNARAYYDVIYDLREQPYSVQERKELHNEVRLYDAYLEGSITERLDFRIGRQVVVWGRSDTIRITDVLNPLDNRRAAIVDIEDLRLPTAMMKLDYYIGEWRITPIMILEQQFSLDPPYGSQFYPLAVPLPPEERVNEPTFAVSIGGEFSGWDVNFYGAYIFDDTNVVVNVATQDARIVHRKTPMLGMAMNYLSGSWLFKGEMAYFDKVYHTMAPGKTLSRLDALLGVEYNGVADTMISYDLSVRHFTRYDARLGLLSITAPGGSEVRLIPVAEDTWQQAFRVSSDFLNDTLHANYLISLFGKRLDEGGFQRLWVDYDIDDSWQASVGMVDYIGGSPLFDSIKDADMLFAEIRYSF